MADRGSFRPGEPRFSRLSRPPRLARALLELVLSERDRAYVLADLAEEFDLMLAEGRGAREARRWYWAQALGSVLPSLQGRSRAKAQNINRRFRERRQRMLSTIWQDVRFGVRTLAKSPTFTGVAILTLALGAGAGTAIFSVVNGVILRPLPFEDPGRLVRIRVSTKAGGQGWMGTSEPEFVDIREGIAAFGAVAAYDTWTLTLGDSTMRPRRFRAITATANLFPMLGVAPLLGRTFTAEEDQPGADLVGVLSYRMWQADFGGASSVLGRTISVNGRPVTVIGVMPADFVFPSPDYEVWFPQRLNLENLWARNNHYLGVVGRLKRGATLQQAQAELNVLAANSNAGYPEFYGDGSYRIRAERLHDFVVADVKTALFVLLGASGFVLLIACVNVANLLLARGEGRKREIAARVALGAGKGRLARQLLTESLLLAAVGGLAGLALAFGGVAALLSLAPASIPRLENVGIDRQVLGFALVLVVATGTFFGFAPAFHAARADVNEILKGGGRTQAGSRGARFARRALVVTQLAMAVLLVLGAGIMIRSFLKLYQVDPGVRTDSVLTFGLSPTSSRVPDDVSAVRYYEDLVPRLAALPGVAKAGAVARLPLATGANNWSFQIEGREVESVGEAPAANVQQATAGYFGAIGLPLVRGRLFAEGDHAEAQPVVIINERMAKEHWPGEDPIGKRMRVFLEGWPWMEIVGIVRDVRHFGLDADIPKKWYVPHAQAYVSAYTSPRSMTIVLHTETDPTATVGPARAIVSEFDPTVPISNVRTMRDVVSASVGDKRFTMLLLGTFAAVALLLAAIGAYGVISYGVSQRTQEIGVRMALGARETDVVAGVLREGIALASLGVTLGVVGGVAMSRLFDALVFEISPTDPLTYAGVVALLGLTALAASFFPAWRASRVDPVISLRSEQG